MEAVGSEADFSQSPAFIEAKAHRVWFSPVYFRKESEPYMTLAMARDGRNAGVTVAEINLKLIWDVITALKIGQGGYAYVVDGRGRLIAHPDISLVLRDTDLSKLPQVAAALNPQPGQAAVSTADNLAGHAVLTAHALIPQLGWRVFVEAPLSEAFAPLYYGAIRTGLLLVFGLVAAALVALLLARRMTGPIRAIAEGAERIGAGDLGGRIEVHTGDELEGLAQQFNRMTADLQKSYAELEQRVADRTAELSEALDQPTATSEVLGVINSSPGDLAPVFDAMLEKAMRLCEAPFGVMLRFQDGKFTIAAARDLPPAFGHYLQTMDQPRGGEMLTQLQSGAPYVHTIDMKDDDAYRGGAPLRRAVVDLAGARTAVVVSLRKDGEFLGTFNLWRTEVRPFSDKQIALLQNFAAQAVIAMENARLITETREALEQQTATAEVLGVINSSPGDLAPVFDAMLEKALALCESAYGVLWTYDGEAFRAAALQAVPQSYAEFLREGVFPPVAGSQGGFARLAAGEAFAQFADVAAEVGYERMPAARALVELGGCRSMMITALRREGRLLGAITIYRKEVRPFSDKQIALLQNFAAQAVIAMENARLITETREALEQQTATAEVLGVINSSPGDLAPVFDAMLDKAMRLCEASFGVLWTSDGDTFGAAALRGVPPGYIEFIASRRRKPTPDTALGELALGKDFVQIPDVASRPTSDEIVSRLVELGNVRTLLVVPLRKDGVLLGSIHVYRQEVRPFSDKQIALLQNFAAQAVIAMENARLITETRERTRDLQESLEYQTATSDVLKVISRSTFDLDPVLENVVETALRLCRAQMGSIFRLDEGVYHWAVGRGFPPEFAAFRKTHPITPTRGSITGRVALEGRVVHIADCVSDPEYTGSEAVEVAKQRTALGVPLLRENAPIGIIALVRSRVEPFTDKEVQLVRTFADQAVIAIENARLLGELRERTDELGRSVEELKALSEVGQEVSSTLDLAAVLATILNRSVGLTGADAGVIFRYSEGQRAFRLAEAVGWEAALVTQVRDMRIDQTATLMGDAVTRRAPAQIPDLRERASNVLRDATLAAGYRSVLVVPLIGADQIFGALLLQRRRPGEFPEASVRLMQTLASQSVLAIQNARLFREIADKSEELRLASQHKSQFLANMSHELRTPMNAILGYTELMVDGIYGELPEKAMGVLERVQNNGKHLLALINDVLDLPKIED